MGTGDQYLVDKDGADPEWSARITYPEPVHGPGQPGCTCGSGQKAGGKSACGLTHEYSRLKKEHKRVDGVLAQGNNRMGKYLMAIRAEVRLVQGPFAGPVQRKFKAQPKPGAKPGSGKRKKEEGDENSKGKKPKVPRKQSETL